MAVSFLDPFNDVINKTSQEIVDSQIMSKISDVLTTFVSSSFQALDSVFVRLADFTKPTPPAASAQSVTPTKSSKGS